MKIRYPADIILEENQFRVIFTDFEECYATGDSVKEAIKNAKRNLSYQLFLYKKQNLTPPEPSKPSESQITIVSETIDNIKELPL